MPTLTPPQTQSSLPRRATSTMALPERLRSTVTAIPRALSHHFLVAWGMGPIACT
jgi:hypothetical protein